MTVPVWQPAKLYPPGSLVQPRTALPDDPVALQNPGFEAGNTSGWDFITLSGPAFAPGATNYGPYNGAWNLGFQFGGSRTDFVGLNQEQPSCAPNTTIQASIAVKFSSAGSSGGQAIIRFYDGGGVQIGADVEGPMYQKPGNTSERWYVSNVTGIAPAGTASVRVGFKGFGLSNADIRFDQLSWNYNSAGAVEGLIFRATQPAAGFSAPTEPVWPLVAGVTVVDHEVIWEGVVANRVAWRARAILRSGAVEPTWTTGVGDRVPDNNKIAWALETRQVIHPKCPNSKIVVIDQGKVYAGDDDIVAFSATNNPLDWGKEKDAGYLPFGLGKYGANPIAAMGLYRGNLVVFNSQGMQLWQIDPDPALNNRIDALPIGSTYHRAFAPVSNDSLFVTALGVRSLGIAASSTNIKSGDVGMPIDPLVQAKLNAGEIPIGLYSPSAGQYWLIFRYAATAEVFVLTINQLGSVGAWSRYLFPFRIDFWAIDGDTLVLRAGDRVLEVREEYDRDLIDDDDEAEIESLIQWHYLEMGGQIGQDKAMEGFDIVGTATEGFNPLVSFGWNQNNNAQFTPEVMVPADTVPDYMIPMELTAPSIAARVRYTGRKWQFSAMNVYLQGRRLAR